MLQADHPEVKPQQGRFVRWLIAHPRTGWWLAAIGLTDMLLQIIDLLLG